MNNPTGRSCNSQQLFQRNFMHKKAVLMVVLVCLLISAGFAQQPNSVSSGGTASDDGSQVPAATLVFGSTLEGTITPGSEILYRVPLEAGEFAWFEIVTDTPNVAGIGFEPHGGPLAWMDLTHFGKDQSRISFTSGEAGDYMEVTTRLGIVSDRAGDYMLVMQAEHTLDSPHKFTIRWLERRPASEKHRKAFQPQKLYRDAFLGHSMQTAIAFENPVINYQTAVENYHHVIGLRKKAGDRAGECGALRYLGVLQADFGRLQEALDSERQSLAIAKELDDQRLIAMSTAELAGVYRRLGENERSLDMYQQSLIAFKAQEDKPGQSAVINNLGNLLSDKRDYEKALEYYRQAYQFEEEMNNVHNRAVDLGNIAITLGKLGKFQESLEDFKQALQLRRQADDAPGAAMTLGSMASILYDMGRYESALDSYQQSLAISREVGNRIGQEQALAEMAKTLVALNRLDEAQRSFQDAVDLVELMRMELIDPENRSSITSKHNLLYKRYVELLMKRSMLTPAGGFDAAAFEISERSRARSVLELLEERRVNLRKDADLQLLEEEKRIGDRITSQTMGLEIARRTKDPEVLQRQTQLENLLVQWREVEEKIRATSPRYASITRPDPVSVKELQALLDDDTALLEINLGSSGQGYMWLVEKHKLFTYSLNNSHELENNAREYYEAVSAPGVHVRFESAQARMGRIVKAREKERRSAAVISDALLQPILPSLKVHKIIIVAAGALQYVPFAALPIPGTSHHMVSRYEVVELPSASVLKELRGKQNSAPVYLPIAVFADPVFDANDPRVLGKLPKSGQSVTAMNVSKKLRNIEPGGISRVSNSRLEAMAIERLVSKKDFAEFNGFAATREQAKKPEMSRFRTVHFATHGFVNAQQEDLSGIVLSLVAPDGKPVDGFLQTHDIFDLNLPADLVVLSGCKTGLGRESNSEGLAGLTRGFMYAGTSRVLVSLWDVDDAATAALMAEFYRGLLGPQKLLPAMALRRAQLKLRSQPRWSHPYYWAGFVLQGDPL